MKNITFSADDQLLKAAREKAGRNKTTLNNEFRLWLRRYAANEEHAEKRQQEYRRVMAALSRISSGGKHFTHDELNER